MRGRPFVEPALRIPVEQAVQRAAQVDTGQVIAASHAIEPRCEPVFERCKQRGVRHVRPFGGLFRCRRAVAYHGDPRTPLLQVLRPRQAVEAECANAREHGCTRSGFDPAAQYALFEHERTQALHPTRNDRSRP